MLYNQPTHPYISRHVTDSLSLYCKRVNIRGGYNFAMFAVDDFSVKLKPQRSFNNTVVYNYLLLHVHLKTKNPRN